MDNNPASGPFGNLPEDVGFPFPWVFQLTNMHQSFTDNFPVLGDTDTLDNFDFESFLHVSDENGLGAFGADFGFGDGVEAGADL